MYWSSIEALLGRLIDDQITIDDIIVYAIVGGAVIGIFATAIGYFSGRVLEDRPRPQKYRTWQRRRRSKALEDQH